jgi:hypothetical protein
MFLPNEYMTLSSLANRLGGLYDVFFSDLGSSTRFICITAADFSGVSLFYVQYQIEGAHWGASKA